MHNIYIVFDPVQRIKWATFDDAGRENKLIKLLFSKIQQGAGFEGLKVANLATGEEISAEHFIL